MEDEKTVETRTEVMTFLDQLKYVLGSGHTTINFQVLRKADRDRPTEYSNRYTISYLFPDEDEVEVLKRELASLTVRDYVETVRDKKHPKRSDMRVFGKKHSNRDVYVKIRVEILGTHGGPHVFVMSFHFAERGFQDHDFPYG